MLQHRRQKGFKILDNWLTKIPLLLHVAKFTFSQLAYKDPITLTCSKIHFLTSGLQSTLTCSKVHFLLHKYMYQNVPYPSQHAH